MTRARIGVTLRIRVRVRVRVGVWVRVWVVFRLRLMPNYERRG